MTLETNIVRRGSVYYLRIRIPSDLINVVGRKEIWRSLNTRDSSKARHVGCYARLAARKAFAWARENISMATNEEITKVIQQLYLEMLDEDESERLNLPNDVDWRVDDFVRWHLEHLGESDEDIQRALDSSSLSAAEIAQDTRVELEADYYSNLLQYRNWDEVEDWADDIIISKQLNVDKDSEQHRRLCLYVIRAALEARKVSMRRGQGDWSATSNDALFANAHRSQSINTDNKRSRNRGVPSIDTLLDKFLDERKGLAPKHIQEMRVSVEWLREYFDDKKRIDEYSVHDIVEYKDALRRTPSNFRKFFRDKTIREAIALNEQAQRATLSVSSINNKRLGNLDTFFGWAQKNAYIDRNPVRGIRVDAPKRARGGKRDPFSVEQLQKIFDAPHFTGCVSSARWKQSGNFKIRDHRFWLPLLALWSGARLGELAQLHCVDVLQIDDIWVIRIAASDAEHSSEHAKHLKNVESERDIPVHPALIDLGFIGYVNEQKKDGHVRLFHDCPLGADGTYSPFSKHFRRFLDSLGIRKGNRVVFHSFRHTFEDAMREAGLQDTVRYRLAGRTINHSSQDYGRGYSATRLFEEISRVRYLGLDVGSLSQSTSSG